VSNAASLIGATLLATACGYSDIEEMDKELTAIEARVPKGTPLAEVPGRMHALGYACDRAPDHLNCVREQPYAIVCRRRVRAIMLLHRDALAGVLVNAGLFCL
jgi:hypothetical protein